MSALPTPYYDRDGVTIYHADAREMLPALGTCAADWVFTDPPYGFRKAAWDGEFPTWWLRPAAGAAAKGMAVMPGVNNLLSMPRRLRSHTYRWTLSVHLTNGMTRGMMGFGNWIPCLVYSRPDVAIYKPQRDCAEIPIVGDMPDHPSPKPLRAITWLLERLPDGSVLDPFMGSGTAAVACAQSGRRFIGIEIEERYCDVAVQRLSQGCVTFAEATP